MSEAGLHVVFGTDQAGSALAAQLAGLCVAVQAVSRHWPVTLAGGPAGGPRMPPILTWPPTRPRAPEWYQCVNAPYAVAGAVPAVAVGVLAAAERVGALLVVKNLRGYGRPRQGGHAQGEGEKVMSLIDEALSANATIANDYDPSRVKPPAPKIAIVTCADPRLTSIEQMLGLAEDDVDMIRNFGTVIDDDAVRSLVLSTRLLGSREIMIINHTDCGMLRFTDSEFEDRLRKETGKAPIAPARFYSFTDAEANTKEQIQKARSHPWISQDVPVRGFVFDVHTGRLSEVFPDGETVTG